MQSTAAIVWVLDLVSFLSRQPSTAGDVENAASSISAFFIDYREEIQGDSVLIE